MSDPVTKGEAVSLMACCSAEESIICTKHTCQEVQLVTCGVLCECVPVT